MSDQRSQYQTVFSAANARLNDLSHARCREIEVMAVRSLRFVGPRPPIISALRTAMRAVPDAEFVQRCHYTLRRLHVAMMQANEPVSSFQVAANAYLDGQPASYDKWLVFDVLYRPWGSK